MSTHLAWPPARFYWAVIEGVSLRRPGPLPPGLVALAGDDIPADLDTLHAVGTPGPDNSVIVCAVERTHLDALDPETISLKPSSTPPGIDEADFELLVGRYEPRPVRNRRLRHHRSLAATVLLCSLLIATGLFRRASHDQQHARHWSQARLELLAQAGIEPAELDRQVQHHRVILDAATRSSAPRDAAPVLAALLQAWPNTSDAFVESVSLSDGRILASVSLASDPGSFLAAFEPPRGWRLEEPRLSTARGLSRIALDLRPEVSP